MVILDNVDVSKLDLNSFRKFECPCELCDCGYLFNMTFKFICILIEINSRQVLMNLLLLVTHVIV